MKILIISPYLPHPQSGHGGGTFLYGLLSYLSKTHQVTLISFADKGEQTQAKDLTSLPLILHLVTREKGKQKNPFATISLAALRAFQVLRSIVLWQPYYVSKFRDQRMARLIAEVTGRNQFDIVQIEYVQMGSYVRFIQSGKKILHDHDIAIRHTYRRHRGAKPAIQRILMLVEWRRWVSYYCQIVKEFDQIITLTEQDKMLLQHFTGTHTVSYSPVGIDVPKQIPRYASRERESLLFIGTFSHQPNLDAAIWLCEEIFPQVLQRFPDATLYIIGANPTRVFQRFQRHQQAIKILGYVDDVVPYLERCAVFVAPLRFGGGVKMKILHAMAHGIPVVTTKIGIEGIERRNSKGALIANSGPKFAEKVGLLLSDQKLATSIGTHGYRVLRKNYSWESVLVRTQEIYNSVLTQDN